MQNEQPAAHEIHETLYDGADILVTYRQGNVRQGNEADPNSPAVHSPALIKVRKIPRSEFSALSLFICDDSEAAEYAEAALYCGKDDAWARSLDEPSLDRVLAEGQRLNFCSFARWFRRRARVPALMENNTALIDLASQVLTRLQPRDSTNGSSPRAIATAISGVTRPTN